MTESLSHHGWKYFDIANLNELFTITLERCGIAEVPEESLAHFENEESMNRIEAIPAELSATTVDVHNPVMINIQNYLTPSIVVNDEEDEGGVSAQVRMTSESERVFKVRKGPDQIEF